MMLSYIALLCVALSTGAAAQSRVLVEEFDGGRGPTASCWGNWSSITSIDDETGAEVGMYFVPLNQAITCMESVEMSTTQALQTIVAYDDMFDLSYAFYDVARDPADTLPQSIPAGWSVYSGPDQGKVNLRQESEKLIAEVQANGANGLLMGKLNSLYGMARDMHTNINVVNPYDMALILVDMGLIKNGSAIPDNVMYLSMSLGDDGKVSPVYKYEDGNGNVIGERRIESIDGENGLDGMIRLSSNLGLGRFSFNALHSEGARVNGFLRSAKILSNASTPGVIWSTGSVSQDISLLPECLDITFAAEPETSETTRSDSQTQWCFFLSPKGDSLEEQIEQLLIPAEALSDVLSRPGDAYIGFRSLVDTVNENSPLSIPIPFDSLLQGEGTSPLANMTRRRSLKALTPIPEAEMSRNFTGYELPGASGPTPVAFSMLDDDTMVFRFEEFANLDDTVEVWSKAVAFARENNATKLLVDMIGNGGGDVNTQYFLRLALYPDMAYEDWADQYSQRISGKMSRILEYIERSTDVLALVNENEEELVAALSADPAGLAALLTSLFQAYYTINNVVNPLGGINLGAGIGGDLASGIGEAVDITLSYLDGEKNATSPDFTDDLKYLVSIPAKLYGAQLKYDTQEVFQGGSFVNTTGTYPLLSSREDFMNTKAKVIPDLPFESYVLLDNGASGSSASTFEQGIRAYASKYAGEVTPLQAVSFGCIGEAETCPMTQFSGGMLGGGNGQLTGVYAVGPGLFSLLQVALYMNESGIVTTEGERNIIDDYYRRFQTDYLDQTPQVPYLQDGPSSYAYHVVYPHAAPFSDNAVPMEFLNQPADGYIPMWPKPGTYNAPYDTSSLPALYSEASKFFQTKSQAAEQMGNSASPPSGAPSPESTSGVHSSAVSVGMSVLLAVSSVLVCLM